MTKNRPPSWVNYYFPLRLSEHFPAKWDRFAARKRDYAKEPGAYPDSNEAEYALERFPAKWDRFAVRKRDHATELRAYSDSNEAEYALERFPAKWDRFAVRKRDHATESRAYSDSNEAEYAPGEADPYVCGHSAMNAGFGGNREQRNIR